ncbi:hypothetical protein COOONC_27094 [Cooperia oncophora]
MIKRERSYYKYVVGDFNAVIREGDGGRQAHRRTTRSVRKEQTKTADVAMDLLEQCKISFTETASSRKRRIGDGRGRVRMQATHSEIDHVLTNRKWSLLDVSVVDAFRTGSDHRLVRAKHSSPSRNPEMTSSLLHTVATLRHKRHGDGRRSLHVAGGARLVARLYHAHRRTSTLRYGIGYPNKDGFEWQD